MNMKKHVIIRTTLMFALLFAAMNIVSAQIRPAMNLTLEFTPGTQLTTTNIAPQGQTANIDERFVDLTINLSGNVQFWAVEIQCLIGRGTELTFDSISFPEQWGAEGTDFIQVPTNAGGVYQSGATLGFTVSRVGAVQSPLGVSGSLYSLPLATVRYQVNDLTTNTSVRPICRVANFLDRNGTLITRGRTLPANDLSIFVGYEINGSVARQGSRFAQNVNVTCTYYPDPTNLGAAGSIDYSTVTDARGNFSFGSVRFSTDTNKIRNFGLYGCLFESAFDGTSVDEEILRYQAFFELDSPTYTLLPITLRPGNFTDANTSLDTIDADDAYIVTGNFNNIVAPFEMGDANGDSRVDATDLALTTGNAGLSTPMMPQHLVYGIGTDYDPNFDYPNSRIYVGEPQGGAVSLLSRFSRTREFWPQLSPDGTTVAFSQENARFERYDLAQTDVATGRILSYRFPRDVTYSAFAPSWSPDGNFIAFVCAEDNDTSSYLRNEGNICLIQAGDTRASTLRTIATGAEIAPPAWIEASDGSYALMYALSGSNTIAYYDLDDGTTGIVPIDNGGSDEVDTPVIVDYLYDSQQYLAYRFYAGGTADPYIKIGTISYDGSGGFAGGVTGAVGASHVALNSTTTGVGFFDVAPSLDIVFYYESPLYSTDSRLQYLANSGGLSYANAVNPFVPDGYVGMPTSGSIPGSGPWNGNDSISTLLHIQRATFDFVP